MDGTQTDGRKGIAYLRDYFLPALIAEQVSTDDELVLDRAERHAVSPAPV